MDWSVVDTKPKYDYAPMIYNDLVGRKDPGEINYVYKYIVDQEARDQLMETGESVVFSTLSMLCHCH